MIYWPGTNIPKSKNNAFNWRDMTTKPLTESIEWKMSVNLRMNAMKRINDLNVYSRARPK